MALSHICTNMRQAYLVSGVPGVHEADEAAHVVVAQGRHGVLVLPRAALEAVVVGNRGAGRTTLVLSAHKKKQMHQVGEARWGTHTGDEGA